MIKHLNKDDFKQTIASDKLVMVDFWASWCGPCRALGPIIDEISNETADALVCKLSLEQDEADNKAIAKEYDVMGIPTIIFFKNSKELHRIVGAEPKENYLEAIAKFK